MTPGDEPAEVEDDPQGPLFGLNLGHLGQVRARDMWVRFAFGAVVSVLAGLVSLTLGPRAGGLFLAFPAILPATLTLLQKQDGTAYAVTDVRGAVAGAVALGGFALTARPALASLGPWGLLPALGAWIVVAVCLYLLDELARRRARRRRPRRGGW